MMHELLIPAEQNTLADLLRRSGQAAYNERRPLCIKIGIEADGLDFLALASTEGFALQLVAYLSQIDDIKALHQLCEVLEKKLKNGRWLAQLNPICNKIQVAYDSLFADSVRDLAEAAVQAALAKNQQDAKTATQRVEQAEQRLHELEMSQDKQSLIDERLHEINFKPVLTRVESVYQRLDDGSAAALFTMHTSEMMGGKWCKQRIMMFLQQKTSQFTPFEVSLPPGVSPDITQLLRQIANKVGFSMQRDVELSEKELSQCAQLLVFHLLRPLQGGDIMFVELGECDQLFQENKQKVLQWFLKRFWHHIATHAQKTARKYPGVKFITLMTASGWLAPDHFPAAQCCDQNSFDSKKMIELPLSNWTKEEIHTWLKRYGRLDAATLEQKTKEIYGNSNGVPVLVYQALHKYLI